MAIFSPIQPVVVPRVRRAPAGAILLGILTLIAFLALLVPTTLFAIGLISLFVATITVPPLDPFLPLITLVGPIVLGAIVAIYAILDIVTLILALGLLRISGSSRGLAIASIFLGILAAGAHIFLTFPLTLFSITLFSTLFAGPVLTTILAIASSAYLSSSGARAIFEPGLFGGLTAQALSGALPTVTSLQPNPNLTFLPTGVVPTATLLPPGSAPPVLGPFPVPMPGAFPGPQFFGMPYGAQGGFGYPGFSGFSGYPGFSGFPQVLAASVRTDVGFEPRPALPGAPAVQSSLVYCPECGRSTTDISAFCDHCGRRLS